MEVTPGNATVLRKVWTTTIENYYDPTLSHNAGDFKRTWQVMADAGLYNYQIKSHPMYRDAMEAMQEGDIAAEIVEGSTDSENERE